MVDRNDRGPWRRWLPALTLSVAVVALAPFLGVLRAWVRHAFGLGYLQWVTVGLAVAAAVALLWALLRIRERRALRYGLLVVAGGLVVLQVLGWSTGTLEADVLERIHLLEYGLLAVLFERAFRPRHPGRLLPVLALAAVALVGLADEGVQWLTPVRTGDGRDVLLNVWAGVVGLLFGAALWPPAGLLRRPGPGTRRLACALGAVVVLAAAAFYDAAHLGHEIRDPRAGVFLSWHAPEELLAAAEDRALRWAEGGPPPQRPVALEDRFFTEAGWHARARNDAVRGDRLAMAWRENRILERWYAPYLDLGRNRWPPAQKRNLRRELETREGWKSGPTPGYRSPALVGRVTTAPPRPLLWAGALALAGALAFLALGRKRDGRGRPLPRPRP